MGTDTGVCMHLDIEVQCPTRTLCLAEQLARIHYACRYHSGRKMAFVVFILT